MNGWISRRRTLWVYLALLANVVVFFHRQLFSARYIFPWDFRGVQLSLISFLTDELARNRLALWNPFSYCGYPVFANIEACFFHPLVLGAAFLAAHTDPGKLQFFLTWVVVLQVWLAGICAWLLFRELGAGRAAAFAGAVIFQTGAFIPSRGQHIHAIMAVCWMPLAWLAVCKMRQGPRRAWLAALGLALGMSVLGGFPQVTLGVFLSTAVLALLLPALRLAPLRLAIYTACGCLLGLGLAAVQFLPTAQLTEYSVARYRADWLSTGGGLYWQSLVSLVLPGHYGIFDLSRFHGPGNATFLYLYCSILGLLLALFALAAVRARVALLLAAMTLFGLFFSLGDKTAVWNWIYPLLPEKVRLGVHPEYCYGIFGLGLAGLAALGLERLRVKEALRWAAAVVIAADLYLVGSGRPMNCADVTLEPGVTRDTFDGSRTLLAEVRRLVNRDYPPARIDTADASLDWDVAATLTRVPTANGVSPLAPASVVQLRLLLHDGARWGWYYPVQHFDSPVLDLMNARYILTRGEAVPALRANPRFRHAASLPGNEVFENLTVQPRFFLVHKVRTAAGVEEARQLIRRREIDLRETAITEEPVALAPSSGCAADAVKTLDYRPGSLELSVEAGCPGLLVLAETWYPGWRAWVDGRETPIHRTDVAFRGVVLPAGSHRVRMEFRPAILWIGLSITLATAALLAALACGRQQPGAPKRSGVS